MQILFLLQVRASSHAHIHTRKEAHGREHAAAGQREKIIKSPTQIMNYSQDVDKQREFNG